LIIVLGNETDDNGVVWACCCSVFAAESEDFRVVLRPIKKFDKTGFILI